jgi:prepilin-type N-terminal cleavage/methylation domain-containing protein
MVTIFFNKKGFSLLELLIVILIAGTLMAIAALSMDYVRKQRVTSAAKQIVADIQQARVNGTMSGAGSTVVFVSPTTYTVNGVNQNLSSVRIWIVNGVTLVPPSNNTITLSRFGYSNTMAVAVNTAGVTGYTRCINIGMMTIQEGFWSDSTSTCQVQ